MYAFVWTNQITDAKFMLEKLSMYKSENKLINTEVRALIHLSSLCPRVQSNSYLTSKKSETWNRYRLQILKTLVLNLTGLQPQSLCLYSLSTCEMDNRFLTYMPCENPRTSQTAFILASRKAHWKQPTLYHGGVPSHQMPQDISGWFFTQSPLSPDIGL